MPTAQAFKSDPSVLERLERLTDSHGEMVALREVAAMVESLVTGLRSDLETAASSVGDEVKSMIAFIESAKRDIASLSPSALATHDIPGAADHLDAVVQHTEEAAGRIMDCADDISALASQAEPELAQKLNDIATRIFEASSFQDITGQRVTKVVRVLKVLEERLTRLAGLSGEAPPPAVTPSQDARPDAHLLNGPQLPGNATNQDDIDALFDSIG